MKEIMVFETSDAWRSDVKEVTMFETNDGVVFQSQEEANEHARQLDNGALVDQWLSTLDAKPATATRAKNAILSFLTWRQE